MNPAPESPKLEACAHCGSTAFVNDFDIPLPTGGWDKMYRVECSLRECGSMTRKWYPRSAAIAAWNTRLPAPTASPALPEGVAGDVETVLDPAPLGMAPAIARYQEAARRLALHVQSQSSTMAGQRDLLSKWDAEISELDKAKAIHDTGAAFTLKRCADELRAALKPVAPGKETL